MTRGERHEVVVVGAGPVGLCLALGLARAGVDVVVLEKEPGTAEHSRAPAIWPGTQEILDRLGVIDRFLAEGIGLGRVDLWDVDRQRVLVRLDLSELASGTAHPRLLIVPQSTTERLLAEALEEIGPGAIRFSSQVVGVEQTADGVEVTVERDGERERVSGRLLAGCDGAHSVVRGEIGGSLDGITYDVRAALADLELEGSGDFPFPRITTRPGPAIGIRMGERLWRLILPYAEDDLTLPERVTKAAARLFPDTPYREVWKSDFRLHRRISSRWRDGRVVLAGDAAHLNSPVGGEGMNAGIADAAALTEALLGALASDDLAPLETFARRRRQAIESGVNRFTDRLTRLLLVGRGRLLRPAFRVASLMLSVPPVRRRVLRRLAMLERPDSGALPPTGAP